MTEPTNLTPRDNYLATEHRTTGEALEWEIELTDSTAGHLTLPIDLKYVNLDNFSGGVAVLVNHSYTDGTNQSPGDLTDSSPRDPRVHTIKSGGSLPLAEKDKEFNELYFLRDPDAAPGTSVIKVYPGSGLANGFELGAD